MSGSQAVARSMTSTSKSCRSRARDFGHSAATCPNRPFLMLPMMIASRSRSFSATCPAFRTSAEPYSSGNPGICPFGFASDDFGNAAEGPFRAVAEPFSSHVAPVVGWLR
jgi:hypothetical protein